MTADQGIHVHVWGGASDTSRRAVLVHGTMTWGEECFAAQRALADLLAPQGFQLEVPDRRGFGDSPDTPRSDWETDAADIAELLGGGAHLVGHSYGGVVAMAAAVLRPEAVRSLTLIEPSALRVAEADRVVAEGLRRNREAFASGGPANITPEEYLRAGAEFGFPVPEFTERRLRATRTALSERPCWEAEIPLEPLARAPWPKLVVNGTWTSAHPGYRAAVGEALLACGAFIAAHIGARRVLVPDTDHFPHRDRADIVNTLLLETWTGPATGAVAGPDSRVPNED
jgi:pimeloyl-ACP methyl ester carboxylesterase